MATQADTCTSTWRALDWVKSNWTQVVCDSNSDGKVDEWSNGVLEANTVQGNGTNEPLPYVKDCRWVLQMPRMNTNFGYCTLSNAKERHI